MKSPFSRSLVVVAGLLLATACDLPFDSNDRREVAVVYAEYLNPPHLVIPDTVQAGESVRLTLTSGGPNGCYGPDRVEVRRYRGQVRVTPYNRVAQGMCAQQPVLFEHLAELRLDTPGTVLLQVVARSSPLSPDASVVVSRAIVVRS